MKKHVMKVVTLLSIMLMLLATVHIYPAQAAATPGYKDGVYTVDYNIYKVNSNGTGSDEVSVMDGFMDKAAQAKATITGGEAWVEVVLNSAHWWLTLEVENNDGKGASDYKYPKVTTVSEDTVKDKKTVKFKVADLGARTKSYVHIDATDTIPGYNNKYDIEFGFDVSSIPLASEEPEQPTLPAVPEADTQLIDFKVLKDGTNDTSSMQKYTPKPAELFQRDGKYYVSFTLASSDLIPVLQYEKNGAYVNATDVSTNGTDNTRVVEFEVQDLTKKLNVRLSVDTKNPTFGIMTHTVQFLFDLNGISFPIDYLVLKDGTNSESSMGKYTQKPAGLTVRDGKYYVSFTLTSSDMIPVLQYEKNGTYVDAVVVSTNADNNSRVVEFEVQDLTKKLNVQLSVDTKSNFGIMTHTVQFQFNPAGTPVTPSTGHDDNGNGDGGVVEEPVGTPGDQIADGQYTVGYKVLKDKTDQISEMANYTVSPAVLTVQNGVKSVSLTLKNSSWITSFQVEKDGKYVDAPVVGRDTVADTRVVKFEVGNLAEKLNAHVKVNIPAMGYNGDYDVQIQFEKDSIKPAGQPETQEPIKDGDYKVTFGVPAEIENYFADSGNLKVENGQNMISITMNEGATISKLEGPDGVTINPYEPEIRFLSFRAVSSNSSVVKFIVPNLAVSYTAYLVEDGGNVTPFSLQFAVQTDSGNSGPSVPTVPTTPTTPTVPNEPSIPTKPSEPTAKTGFYQLNYTILKDGTNSPSVMETYVEHPGVIEYAGSQLYAYITLTQSAEITGFKVGGSDVSTVADLGGNKRLVKFEVPNLSSKLSGWVKIDWESMNYHHSYDIQISFDGVGAKVSDPGAGFQKPATELPKEQDKDKDTDKEIDKETNKDNNDDGTKNGSGETTQPNIKLNDISKHWAKSSIERAVSLGFVKGYQDGTFHPDSEVTRAEFATMIVRALKLEGNEPKLSFKDNIPTWAQSYVAQAVKAGIINGYDDHTFRAADKTTRTELTVMIVRALGLPVDSKEKLSFADNNKIPAWAHPYVVTGVKAGLINGRSNNLFAPNAHASRAEAVTLILRMLDSQK